MQQQQNLLSLPMAPQEERPSSVRIDSSSSCGVNKNNKKETSDLKEAPPLLSKDGSSSPLHMIMPASFATSIPNVRETGELFRNKASAITILAAWLGLSFAMIHLVTQSKHNMQYLQHGEETSAAIAALCLVFASICLVALVVQSILLATWNCSQQTPAASRLGVETVKRASNGKYLTCNIRALDHAEDKGAIAVICNGTEPNRLFEADRAHSETLARQRDAQAINRFTRHEIKNGLLAAIELCACAIKSSSGGNEANHSMPPPPPTTNKDTESDQLRFMKELDSQLQQTLDTVLAEAMARDVIHEVYLPRRERVNVKELLQSSSVNMGSSSDLFPLEFSPQVTPDLMLDPQLVRYIHRNAVSNACKYGKKQGGVIKTIVKYNADSKDLVMSVINEPGTRHKELMALAQDASTAVFAQGKRLHVHLVAPNAIDNNDLAVVPPSADFSCGDGAWIMQKCAKTMDGECRIEFCATETVFTFQCRANAVAATALSSVVDFKVPPDTWGVAVDDSLIQRKLLAKILTQVGVEESRLVVTGKNPNEIKGVQGTINTILREHPESNVLLLMDENLDFRQTEAEQVLISGSLVMQDILAKLSPQDESRLCVLMRSANDSAKDIEVYSGRTHGFFPKAPMQRERVSEILAPLWVNRFGNKPR